MSIRGKTYTDRRLRTGHICDIIIVLIIIFVMKVSYSCDADTMAKQYEKYGDSMSGLIYDTKALVPDSVRLKVEFDMNMFEDMNKSAYLNESQTKELKKRLKDIKCIGIGVNHRHDGLSWNTVYFRRIQWGMYSFRFYDRPLTKDERDEINRNNPYLIVYNDTVAFEYGGGVFGSQIFEGKKEFLERLTHNPQD